MSRKDEKEAPGFAEAGISFFFFFCIWAALLSYLSSQSPTESCLMFSLCSEEREKIERQAYLFIP